MSEPPVSRLQDADMQGTYAALLRAARRAREIAWMTGTAVVYMRDGNLVFEYPVGPEPPSNALALEEYKGQSGGELS
jgi:hypothetical protein